MNFFIFPTMLYVTAKWVFQAYFKHIHFAKQKSLDDKVIGNQVVFLTTWKRENRLDIACPAYNHRALYPLYPSYTPSPKGIMEMVRVAEAHTKSYVIIFYRLYSYYFDHP